METTAPILPERINEVSAKRLWGTRKMPDLVGLIALVPHTDTLHDLRTIRAPFTGEVLGEVPICTTEDVQIALQHPRNAQRSWAQTRMSERKAIFLRYHDLILEHQEELLNLLQVEAGKSRLTAQDEVFDVVINSRHYAVRAGDTSVRGDEKVLFPS